MKSCLTLIALICCLSAVAAPVKSTRKDKVSVARVVKLIKLVDKADIQVSIVVEDLGGSTDLSPTQKAYLTLYSKGEMFSTDATFVIADVIEVKSAVRVAGGVYELTAVIPDESAMMKEVTFSINAADAIVKIKAVKCDDFDCEASTKFAAKADISIK